MKISRRKSGAAARAPGVTCERLEQRCHLALTHLYTFNVNANDSVGTAHVALFNGAQVSNGRLLLQNTGLTSGSATAQYGKLPANTLPASGSVTIEAWYTTFSATPNWMRVFDFGDQVGSNGNSYLFYTPKSSAGVARASIRAAGVTEAAPTATTRANHGYLHMAAVVVDSTAGQLLLYVDGALSASAALGTNTLASINDVQGFLGRSLFNADAAFSGAIDELRIYDEARPAATIAADATAGPAIAPAVTSVRQAERLDRSVVAVSRGSGQVYVGWRLLGTDPSTISFNVYRTTGGVTTKRNATPITATTNFTDTGVTLSQANVYFVRPVLNNVEQAASATFTLPANASTTAQYVSVPMNIPAGGTHRDGTSYTYFIQDTSVGDLDGDGKYEFVVRWQSAGSGLGSYWAPYILDAYRMDGTQLWRINLGKNISDSIDGYLVYDLDGDGRAEVVSRTADGTVSGTGQVIGDPNADWVNTTTYPTGWVMRGPEYFTVFNGLTGAAMATRALEPARGNLTDWGDNYGQRGHQIFIAAAYFDGQRPSIVFSRGIYFPMSGLAAQNQMVAWDWRNGALTKRWHFRAGLGINGDINSNFVGQGNHQITVADVDADGKDEVIIGSMIVDDDGTPVASTQLEHGDALHVSDLDPSRPGLEVFGIHENEGTFDPTRPYGAAMYDPRTGVTLWGAGRGIDVGRGNAADIDPTHPGAENWGGPPIDNPQGAGVIRDVHGQTLVNASNVALPVPNSNNFFIWWDADMTRELLDRTYINKWDWTDGSSDRLFTASGVSTSESTKETPAVTGDLLGDWREEVVWRASDSTELRIYTTVISATNRMYTLMHDSQYRLQVALQMNGYNQPPHPSFFIGANMATPPTPNLTTPAAVLPPSGVLGTAVPPDRITVSWTAEAGALGYVVRRATGSGSFAVVATLGLQTSYADANLPAGQAYRYTVASISQTGETLPGAPVTVTIPLPTPFTAQDIGSVVIPGQTYWQNGVYTVASMSADIGGANDAFRFVSQPITTDGTVSATVLSQTKNAVWPKAGVMIRASTAANSAWVDVVAGPGNGVAMQWRTAGGVLGSTQVAGVQMPVQVRLVRAGNSFTGSYSSGGGNWVQIGTPLSLTMPTAALAGIAVTSNSAFGWTTAQFVNLAWTGQPARAGTVRPPLFSIHGPAKFGASGPPASGLTGAENPDLASRLGPDEPVPSGSEPVNGSSAAVESTPMLAVRSTSAVLRRTYPFSVRRIVPAVDSGNGNATPYGTRPVDGPESDDLLRTL